MSYCVRLHLPSTEVNMFLVFTVNVILIPLFVLEWHVLALNGLLAVCHLNAKVNTTTNDNTNNITTTTTTNLLYSALSPSSLVLKK